MGFTFQRARPMEGIKIMKENSANNPHGITFPSLSHTTNPTILSSLGESWILDEWLVVGGVEGGNDDRNDDWNGARQRQIAWTTSDS